MILALIEVESFLKRLTIFCWRKKATTRKLFLFLTKKGRLKKTCNKEQGIASKKIERQNYKIMTLKGIKLFINYSPYIAATN